jgi:hypothetical protein
MLRWSFSILFAAVIALIGQGTYAAPTVPNLSSFSGDLANGRATAIKDIWVAHHILKPSPAQLKRLDLGFLDLWAAMNGFLDGVAVGVERDQFSIDEWQRQAATLTTMWKAFDNSVKQLQIAEATAEAAGTRARGAASGPGPTGTVVTLNLIGPALPKLFDPEVQHKLREDGQRADDEQRRNFANSVRSMKWCTLDEAIKTMCPALTAPQPQPLTSSPSR